MLLAISMLVDQTSDLYSMAGKKCYKFTQDINSNYKFKMASCQVIQEQHKHLDIIKVIKQNQHR
jgi:hypothetical protein